MKYRFSNCELDTERRELQVGSTACPTEPMVFDLLCYLIENREKVVSKDDIIESVWEGRIVSDETLSSRISSARKAVGDSGQSQRIIRTIPRRGFRFVADVGVMRDDDVPPEDTVKGPAGAFHPVNRPAIAVLPFKNLGNDPEQEYFSDGLTEDIISALAQWRMFPVISRISSFVYKDRALDITTIGRELSARYVLEGSVRKIGNRLRVTTQLIDAPSGHHVWTEHYDREFSGAFALQDEISRTIAAALEPTMGKAEIERLSAKHPDNLNAWDMYLRGRARLHEFTKEGNVAAREMFEKAVALDPHYSRGYADLAWTHSRDLLLEYSEDRQHSLNQLFEAARNAVKFDEASSRAHIFLATAHLWRNEHDLALKEARKAYALNPSDSHAQYQLGNILDLVGESEGIDIMEKTIYLDRQNQPRPVQLTFLARATLNRGNYAKAIELARQSISNNPRWTQAYYILAICFGHTGDYAAACAAFEECDRLQPGFTQKRANWAPYLDPASNEHMREGLRKAGLVP